VSLLPPDTPDLIRRLVARNARRARIVSLRLADFAGNVEQRHACRAFDATLTSLRGPQRAEFLYGADLRAWLWTAEEGITLARSLEDDADLFERISEGPYLAELVPMGRLDRDFRRRTRAFGERLIALAFRRLPLVLAFLTPENHRFGPFTLDTAPSAAEARREGELHLRFPVPATLRVAKGARVELLGGGLRILQRGRAAGWKPREQLAGTRIVLTRRIFHARDGWRPGGEVRGLSAKLSRAVELVREAWEEVYRDLLAHTHEVVPMSERRVAPDLLPGRPGASYIHYAGKSAAGLAVDLVHENAHHRIQGLAALGALHRDHGETMYFSPWRRTMRPLEDILQSTYALTFRMELLRRLVGTKRRLPRARIRQEMARELDALRRSLLDLEDAESRKLLTPAGARIRRAIGRRVAQLGRKK